ncbi:MAG: molecular chaperone DnaK, partial [Planctomycetota bacterium]
IHLKDLKLDLTVAEPVEFSLHVSSTRLADKAGEILAVDPEQMKALPPIRTVLRTERRNQKGTIPVTLHAHLSEIGTIDLGCQAVDTEHRWRLQFDVRSATETDRQAHVSAAEDEGVVDEGTWQACEAVIEGVFAEGGEEKPAKILRRLSETLGSGKFDWPTSLLRRIWEKLLSMQEGRKRSPAHEARWLNLLGFALRPGYGLAVDDWRVAETWRHVNKKLAHAGASKNEALILWRRIAGGLTGGQQSALADPMISSLRAAHSILIHNRQARGEPMYPMHESEEAWRLLGSLENLEADVKLQVGKMLVDLFPKRRYEKMRGAMLWSLGRLGGRQPLYGPLNNLVSSDTAYRWCKSIMEFHQQDATHRNVVHLALMQLARKTEDRHRDLSDSARQEVISFLNETETRPRYIELVESGGELQAEETASVFGEALPKGFRIQS